MNTLRFFIYIAFFVVFSFVVIFYSISTSADKMVAAAVNHRLNRLEEETHYYRNDMLKEITQRNQNVEKILDSVINSDNTVNDILDSMGLVLNADMLLSREKKWIGQIKSELNYWDKRFKTASEKEKKSWKNFGRFWFLGDQGGFDQKIDRKLITNFTVRVLECGASFTSKLGKKWRFDDRTKVQITPCDPLAKYYNELLLQNKIVINHPVSECEAEKLSNLFPYDHFDLVHFMNSLDHASHPILGLIEALKILKPGQPLYALHVWQVGKKENYVGLHTWDFYSNERGQGIIESYEGKKYNLNVIFKDVVERIEITKIKKGGCVTGRIGGISVFDCIEYTLWKKK